MIRRIFTCGALLVLNCNLCLFVFAGDFSVRKTNPLVPLAETPFKLYGGYMIVVDGRIGNLDHQNLLLDTGTNPTMIDKSVCLKLGLLGVPRDLSLFNQTLVSESAVVPEVQFGPTRRRNLQVMVADFSKVGNRLGIRIDAVIGLDVLGGTSFTVDYVKQQIFFRASPQRHTVSFTSSPQFIGVNITSGRRQLHLLLDTGTPQWVLFENHLRGADYVSSARTSSGNNISGEVPFYAVTLLQASIGTQQVGPQKASVVTSHQGIANGFDGLFGISCLRPKRISVDFERQVLGWSD